MFIIELRYIYLKFNTYRYKQCAAVSISFVLMMLPPQKWLRDQLRIKETCKEQVYLSHLC